MYLFDVSVIKCVHFLLPLAKKIITSKQPSPPIPDATTFIPSPYHHPVYDTTVKDCKPNHSIHGDWFIQQRRLKADIYYPARSPTDPDAPSAHIPLPIVINLHGSGLCFHRHGADASFFQYLAKTLPAVVIDVDYSHAPEHPWPQPVDDVDSAIIWAKQFAKIGKKARKQFGIHGSTGQFEWEWENTRIAVVGFSEGGNLALVTSTRTHVHGGIQAVAAFYPSTRLDESPYNKPKLAPVAGAAGDVLPTWLRRMLHSCYLSSKVSDRKNPSISPLYAPVSLFPPSVTILTAEQDSLAREGVALLDRLQGSRSVKKYYGDALHWVAVGQGHDWDKMTRENTEPAKLKDEAYALVAQRFRSAFAQVSVGDDDEPDYLVTIDEEEESSDFQFQPFRLSFLDEKTMLGNW